MTTTTTTISVKKTTALRLNALKGHHKESMDEVINKYLPAMPEPTPQPQEAPNGVQ